MSIILTGGSGTLGNELQKQIDCVAPPKRKLNIQQELLGFDPKPELIVHCAAFTDLVRAEKEKQSCYNVNVIGTRNLASLGIPMLYISTAYVFDGEKGNYVEEDAPNPQNYYSLTKLLGEYEARRAPRSVVVRCLFKPRPFEHAAACDDQFTTGSYVDQLAAELACAIRNFDKLPETLHIGAERKSTFELARETRPDVRPIRVADITAVRIPRDVSLNSGRWQQLKRSFND